MSVKRYTNGADDDQGIILPFMEESPNGDYVEYADYASLKAEVERVEPELEQRCRELNLSLGQQAVQLRQIGELKAEVERLKEGNECLDKMHEKEMARSAYLCEQVERLRKAGDDLDDRIDCGCEICNDARAAWNAAKEGKQS